MTTQQKIICLGEILLRYSTPDSKLLFQQPLLETHVGGAEANVAVNLSQLGHSTEMVSCLPNNQLGQYALGELRKYNVGVKHVLHGEGRMGQYYFIKGHSFRRSEVIYDREYSAFSSTSEEQYNWSDIFDNARWLHISGITPALSESATHLLSTAIDEAVKAGTKISFDGNFRESLWKNRIGEAPKILYNILSKADIAFINEKDIALVLNRTFRDKDYTTQCNSACSAVFNEFPKLKKIYFTNRAKLENGNMNYSAFSYSRTKCLKTKSFILTKVVDRIGTGDAFAAGVLHSINAHQESKDKEQLAIDFGIASAVLKHSIAGDFNLASEAQIKEVINMQDFDIKR